MPSRSSRRKNGLSGQADQVAKLLQDGAVFTGASSALLAAAGGLAAQGLIKTTTVTFVRCANAEDPDFSSSNRQCRGRIIVDDGLGSPAGVMRCPECDRSVYPDNYNKHRYTELRSSVSPTGVMDHIEGILKEVDFHPHRMGQGAWRVDVGDERVIVCVIEYCEDQKHMSRDRAVTIPTCYVAVNSRDLEDRFLEEAWIKRTSLTEIVCGTSDLPALIRAAAAAGTPATTLQASIPVCSRSPVQVIAEPLHTSTPARRFVVEVGPKTVHVEGLKVVAEQASTRYVVFQVLWETFLEDMRAGLPINAFRATTLKDLIAALESRTGRLCSDVESVRHAVNRLQQDIEKAVKRDLGHPIDRDDIIQTCRWQGQNDDNNGYRINPQTVAARPFQGNLAE